MVKISDDAQIQITINREAQADQTEAANTRTVAQKKTFDASSPFEEAFPLLRPIDAQRGQVLLRFTVTQLINFQRCGRQYYFDRMLRTPGVEERSVWNDAEAPEPPANLTATLKGAVIHRFCEMFREGEDVEARLATSFNEVLSQRQAELVGRALDIEPNEAVRALLPLAENYLKSDVFRRVSELQRINSNNPQSAIPGPQSNPGLWSELRFRLRRPLGILTGTIDKLLINVNGDGVEAEIVDFKTNRFPSAAARRSRFSNWPCAAFRSRGGRSLDPISNNKCLTKSLGLNSVQNTNAVRASPLIRSIAERSSTVLPSPSSEMSTLTLAKPVTGEHRKSRISAYRPPRYNDSEFPVSLVLAALKAIDYLL